ncbi:hypothetical protein E4U31_007245 [Claviceps sp. LM219 group G6]|nr:hypothetical protein E4U31_007245 [Claviceps sp. LM219 group G6]
MESSTPFTLPRGFVDTTATATDGRRLRIYYLRKTPVLYRAHDYRRHVCSNDAAIAAAIIRAKLLRAAEIEVLRDFAAAYTRGERDLNGKEPFEDVQPIGIILIRIGLHVFSVDNVMAMGYQTWNFKEDFLETERTAYYRSDQQNQIGPEEKRQVHLFVKMKTK